MEKQISKISNLTKLSFSFLACTIIRLLRFFPNNDPILGFVLPLSKNHSSFTIALFAFLNMFLFDFITGKVGLWTWVTSTTYGLIIFLYGSYMRNTKTSFLIYIKHATLAIILFDTITGPILSSLAFNVPFAVAAIAQIPFTLMHLVSGCFYIVLLSPIIDPQLRVEMERKIKFFLVKT